MPQANINIRMDEDLKHDMEDLCQRIGMNLTTAITVFLRRLSWNRVSPSKSPQTHFIRKQTRPVSGRRSPGWMPGWAPSMN